MVEERTGSGTAVSHWRIGVGALRRTIIPPPRAHSETRGKGWSGERDERAGGPPCGGLPPSPCLFIVGIGKDMICRD